MTCRGYKEILHWPVGSSDPLRFRGAPCEAKFLNWTMPTWRRVLDRTGSDLPLPVIGGPIGPYVSVRREWIDMGGDEAGPM